MAINIKKVRPMFTDLITTMDKYEELRSVKGVIVPHKSGTIKEHQTVVAIGPNVIGIQVGDLVSINPIRYARMKHQEGSLKDGVVTDNPVVSYQFNIIELDGKEHLLLQNNDINYVVEKYEEVKEEEPSPIIQQDRSIIL